MKHLRYVIVALLALGIFYPARAHAEAVSAFDSTINVAAGGRVDVTETIRYDFEGVQRHGIYRYIPVVYKDDADNAYKPSFQFDATTVDDQAAKTKVTRDGDNMVLRVGDPNRTITGIHTYVIRYHFESLVVDKGGDLLRFDVTGDGWQVPLRNVTARIVSPVTPKIACYTGTAGSKDQNCQVAGTTVSTAAVSAGDGFTIEALWPSGTIANLLVPYKTPWWQQVLIIGALIYVAAGFVLIIAAAVRWLGIRWAERRARQNQTIIAQYDPPKNLTAGELGLLHDNKVSMVEVTATLIQAAVRGIIRIELVNEASIFKRANYKLVRIGDMSKLPADEQPLLKALFGAADEVELKNVDHTTVPAAVTTYQNALRASLKQKELYTAKSKFATTVTATAFVFLIIMLFTPFIFFVGFVILPLGLYVYHRAGQIPRLTAAGLESWAYVEGFKLFLSVTEKDRLAFTDAPKRTPKQFSQFLPYAIALGVEQEWAKQFEGIDITQATGWYDGHGQAFTAAYVASSLHDSFAPAVSTASASPSSTSSGGFGGGSSGGGFGGGGGGSW